MSPHQSELDVLEVPAFESDVVYDLEPWSLTPSETTSEASDNSLETALTTTDATPVNYMGALSAAETTRSSGGHRISRLINAAKSSWKRLVAVSVAASVPSVAPIATPSASAAGSNVPAGATYMGGELWNIKDNPDLSLINNKGNYEWIDCGYTIYPNAQTSFEPCKPGESPIFVSEQTMATYITSGNAAVGSTVILDLEDGHWPTPKSEKGQGMAAALKAGVQVAHSHGVKIMETPFVGTPNGNQAMDIKAAAAGADYVDIQDQIVDSSSAYPNAVKKAADAIVAANPNTLVLAGLSTDAGGHPTGVGTLYADFKSARKDPNIKGFWLNVHPWVTHGHGCATQGCAATGIALVNDVENS